MTEPQDLETIRLVLSTTSKTTVFIMEIDQWVERKIAEARRNSVSISKRDFKRQLISERPNYGIRIRQLVNL